MVKRKEHAPISELTLRDFFAALAMQGSLSADDSIIDPNEFAQTCYVLADAMLEARS
jgi:hypothetical protein